MWQLQQRYAALRDKPYFSYAVGLYVTLFVQLVHSVVPRNQLLAHSLTHLQIAWEYDNLFIPPSERHNINMDAVHMISGRRSRS